MKISELKPGDKVYYVTPYDSPQNGIVKSLAGEGGVVFVVYKCNGDWHNYQNYTGEGTVASDLRAGWYE